MEEHVIRAVVLQELCKISFYKAFYSKWYSCTAVNELWENLAEEEFSELAKNDKFECQTTQIAYNKIDKYRTLGTTKGSTAATRLAKSVVNLTISGKLLDKCISQLTKAKTHLQG